jgi:hypothetical protein
MATKKKLTQKQIHSTLDQIEKLTKKLPESWQKAAFDRVRYLAYPENAIIIWQPDDIEGIREDWSREKCAAWLERYADDIRDRSIEEGWEIINILLGDTEDEFEDGTEFNYCKHGVKKGYCCVDCDRE